MIRPLIGADRTNENDALTLGEEEVSNDCDVAVNSLSDCDGLDN